MAKKVNPVHYGIDASKRTLDIAMEGAEGVISVENSSPSIEDWLTHQVGEVVIAIEATNTYHEALVDQALLLGHTVYLVNARQLKHYRDAIGGRAKTDAADALLLLRYVLKEGAQLRPLSLRNTAEKRVWQLLKRRGTVVNMRKTLTALCEGVAELEAPIDQLILQMNRTLKAIDKVLHCLAKRLGWQPMLDRVQGIPGIGELNAMALTACYHRGEFRTVDAFIAFIGLDVRVRDSGTMKGKRKLTKKGEPEIRRLLYNAAMSFDRNPAYRGYRQSLLARGLSSTAAYVIIARKLARVAFTLLRKGEEFDENVFRIPCHAT